MPFNVDDPWTTDDTRTELCDCTTASDDPTNPDAHSEDCAALTAND